MQKKWLFPVFSILLVVLAVPLISGCAGPTTVQGAAPPVQVSQQPEGIWVSGTGEVNVTPDIGILTLGIVAQQATVAQSQSAAKAFFVANPNSVAVTNLFTNTELFRGYLKTSNVGSILAGVSMECVLWTYTSTTGTTGGGKNSTSARAAVVVNVSVDGNPAIPGQVVYCDRLQAVGVTLVTGVTTDQLTIELFQATKNANHFNFFAGPLNATLHEVIVTAR